MLSTRDFLCRIKGRGPGSEVLLGPPRLPQSFVSPFPYLPAFCGVGGAEPEGEQIKIPVGNFEIVTLKFIR